MSVFKEFLMIASCPYIEEISKIEFKLPYMPALVKSVEGSCP